MKKFILTALSVSVMGLVFSCNSMNSTNTGNGNTATSSSGFKAGKYAGKTPSGNVMISFNADNTFALEETFSGSTDPMSSTGTWKFDSSTKKVILVYKNLADRVTTFSVVDGKTIQMNTGSAWTSQTSGSEYNLTRQ